MGYLERLLGNNEKIVLIRRQHWIKVFGSFLVNGLLIALLWGAAIFCAVSKGEPFEQMNAILVPVLGGLSLIPLVRLFLGWLHWWMDIYVVTNRRIIQIKGIVNKNTIDSSLEKINDLVLRQTILGRIFDYGDIEVLTGSEVGVNNLRRVSRPVQFKTEMLNQKEGVGQEDSMERRVNRALDGEPAAAEDVPDLIAELDELRKKGLLSDAEFDEKKAKLLSRI